MNPLSTYKTVSVNKMTADKQWFVVDANGQTLGRMASQIASVLRGKNKPSYTPHVDCGDNVIVINSDKVRLTGDKWDAKVYVRHTGYPGGIYETNFQKMQARFPGRALEKAVKGMLPKGPLGYAMIKKLKVYADATHPHAAQQPQVLDI